MFTLRSDLRKMNAEKAWMEVPANVRREIERFHVNMGHLSTTAMIRMLRRAGAKPEVLKYAEFFKCQSCQDTMRKQHPRPTRYMCEYVFNVTVSADVSRSTM